MIEFGHGVLNSQNFDLFVDRESLLNKFDPDEFKN
jgi:hypothetical protein